MENEQEYMNEVKQLAEVLSPSVISSELKDEVVASVNAKIEETK